MKTVVVVGLKLFAICAVAALTLGGINAITEPVIIQRKIMELQQALDELTPDAQTGEAMDVPENSVVVTRYPVMKEGQSAGMLLELEGSGYAGEMKILARYEEDGTIRAVRLMDNTETPGLGKKAENPVYMEKFLGTGSAEKPVPVRKDMLQPGDADAVTGATITFLGISKALAEGAEYAATTAGGR
ncbi:MAG: FMN-binding protein [Spirochaetaceae bacterium]|nr:MAG: FMN-binding protein [Spirochaetaceae bacterium]